MKIMRLAAQADASGRDIKVADIDDTSDVSLFDIALHLDRAFERGEAAASIYIERAIELGVLYLERHETGNIAEVVQYLGDRLYEGTEFFRTLPYWLKNELADALSGDPEPDAWMDVYDDYVFNEGFGRRQQTKTLAAA